MKRLHIHIGVENVNQSIQFYNALFNAQPVKSKPDYAKWMLDDPCINFAISTESGKTGVNHLGIQVDENEELEDLRDRLKNADMALFDEGETVCCYARSDKSWVKDPSGIAWEAYKTMEDVQLFSGSKTDEELACSTPEMASDKNELSTEKSSGCCG